MEVAFCGANCSSNGIGVYWTDLSHRVPTSGDILYRVNTNVLIRNYYGTVSVTDPEYGNYYRIETDGDAVMTVTYVDRRGLR